MVFSLYFSDKLPEKWLTYWKDVRYRTGKLILFEILITEIFYKLAEKKGLEVAEKQILFIKSLNNTKIVQITDTEAIGVGENIIRNEKFGLSIVDSYTLTLAKKSNAKVITTDSGLKDACKKNDIEVDYLPL